MNYDRVTGAVDNTLGQLAAQAPGTYGETFHFVLNNTVAKDNRIPPYGFSYDEAHTRNALPVPANQYGSPAAGGTYNYWDEVALNPPPGATRAEIRLLYQPTSWEYVQFLYLANNGQNAFLANEGVNMLNAWLNTGMAEPHVMATANWPGTAVCRTCRADQRPDRETGLHANPIELAGGCKCQPIPGVVEQDKPILPARHNLLDAEWLRSAAGTTFPHSALGSPAANYSYLVQPAATCGPVQAMPSNRTAAFKYALTPGQ